MIKTNSLSLIYVPKTLAVWRGGLKAGGPTRRKKRGLKTLLKQDYP